MYENYEKALKTTKRGKVSFLKRRNKERWVNNYNPEMLYAWNANMNIQLAFDPYAVVTYIVSYMNIDEKQMTKLIMAALKAEPKQNAREKLKKIEDGLLYSLSRLELLRLHTNYCWYVSKKLKYSMHFCYDWISKETLQILDENS